MGWTGWQRCRSLAHLALALLTGKLHSVLALELLLLRLLALDVAVKIQLYFERMVASEEGLSGFASGCNGRQDFDDGPVLKCLAELAKVACVSFISIFLSKKVAELDQ